MTVRFRDAEIADHPLLAESRSALLGARVGDEVEGPRCWIVTLAYAYGQRRIQVWHENPRGCAWPDILHEF